MTRETLGKEMMVSISLIVDLRLKGGAKGGNIHKCCYNKVEIMQLKVGEGKDEGGISSLFCNWSVALKGFP